MTVVEKQTPALDWRAAAEAHGRAAFEAATAAEAEPQSTPARPVARRGAAGRSIRRPIWGGADTKPSSRRG